MALWWLVITLLAYAMAFKKDILACFWSKVNKTETCWLWTAYINERGYGKFMTQGRCLRAHRFSYSLHNGLIPPGLCVLHKCDVRNCVNPDHLFLGTNADNSRDMISKGRARPPDLRGEKHPASKLTKEQVIEIRNIYNLGNITQVSLGKQFGVSNCTIFDIVRYRKWRF